MIGRYEKQPVECLPWNGRAATVAAEIAAAIRERVPEATVEHVGSTAIPGCDGKGVIDFAITGPLEPIKAALAALGFQRQTGREPFPEDRPMRVGSYQGFRLHAHVVGAAEAAELVGFRDRLRRDRELVRAYIALKRELLACGITDGVDYAHAKTDFIRRVLADERI